MKLGQVYFREQDFANALSQFEILAKDHPDGPFAETALFLAAQCSAQLIEQRYQDRALALFAQVVARKGPLKYHALFQQGLIQHARDEDAGAIFQSILDAQPPAPVDLRAAALCAKGDNLVRIAKGSPEKLGAAVSAYTQLAEMTDVGPEWHNKAVYKQCKALLQLGREQEALFFYSKLLDTASDGAKETFWLYKAGFEAAEMLKQQGNVRGALAVYEKLGKIPGARAEEARTIVKELRLKHFIWN
jgi:tetratricopeptide (TPR) repeat protein